jgi:hypothetical protein
MYCKQISGIDTDPSDNILINIKKSVCIVLIGVPQMADEAFVDSSVCLGVDSMARGLRPLVLITLIDYGQSIIHSDLISQRAWSNIDLWYPVSNPGILSNFKFKNCLFFNHKEFLHSGRLAWQCHKVHNLFEGIKL